MQRIIFLNILLIVMFFNSTLAYSKVMVKVGVHESKPLSFTSKDGTITGIYPEVINEVARHEGWNIEFINVSWVEGLQMVKDGEIDLLGPIGFVKERLNKFNFNNEAVLVDWGQIYLPKNSKIENILDLEGKKVVFQKGHMMGTALVDLLKRFDIYCEIKTVKNQEEVFKMISSGSADAGAVNRLFGIINEKNFNIKQSQVIYAPIELRFAAPKTGNKKLLDQLDARLKRLKENKESKYQHIMDKWLFGTLEPGWHATMKQVLAIIGIGTGILVLMFLWLITLKSQVKTRTKELEKSAEKLKDTNLLLNSVMDNTTDAIFMKNLSGEYLFANASTCKVMDKSLNQVLGKTDAQLFPAEAAKVIKNADDKIIKTAKSHIIEEKLNTVHGETYWMANKNPYFDEDNKVAGIIGISRNISELKKTQREKENLQEQLRQTHKMEAIGTLAGGIAHDFNNILGIIIGNIELAFDDIHESSSVRSNMNEIMTASLRARDVVRQLLSFSRKIEQPQEPVNINNIVEESMNLLRASIPATIEFKMTLSDSRDKIMADATQIHQVLINLCTNAAHAMEDNGGILNVKVIKTTMNNEIIQNFEKANGDWVCITVSDTGKGMDSETQKKMFDPYYTSKEIGKGTGLGLAVVHGIVKSHNGVIEVQSEVSKGSSVSVCFPLCDQQIKTKQTIPEKLQKGDEKLLFIDDETSLVAIGKLMIEKLGYEVETITDPEEALDLFSSDPFRFDLIITDMTMPHLTGVQLAKEVLQIRPDMPIILCTGFSDKINNQKALELGIKKYIEKPLNIKEFAKTIRETLDESKTLSQQT